MNCIDRAPVFTPFKGKLRNGKFIESKTTPWDSLTDYEKLVESFLTPERFEFFEYVHGAPQRNFPLHLSNDRKEKLHLFFPTNFDNEAYPYIYYNDLDDIFERNTKRVVDYDQSSLESN